MPDTAHCCCPNPCEYILRISLDRCPPLDRPTPAELYTFTLDGPGGEHQVTSSYADVLGGAGAYFSNPSPGEWTVSVSGPAGSYSITVMIEACKNTDLLWHAMHGFFMNCYWLSSPIDVGDARMEGVGWSVSGTGVGTPSSGTTSADGGYAFLLCEDGSYTTSFTPPSGTHWQAASGSLVKSGAKCPTGNGMMSGMVPEDGYRCACNNDCPYPVRKELVLTTKYGSYTLSDHNASTGYLTVSESEARAPITCPITGFVYCREDGASADAKVLYELDCPYGDNGGKFQVRKSVYVLPSYQPDGYGVLVHVGWRLSTVGATVYWLMPPVITSGWSCHTVAGTGTQSDAPSGYPHYWQTPCVMGGPLSNSWPLSEPNIPGSGDTYTISEAP